jgi:hypothetical protein
MMANEAPRPGTLNVLLGAMKVAVLAVSPGATTPMGSCTAPGSRRRSQWISSEQRNRSCCAQNSATLVSSARVQTRATGLCGWQKRSTFVRGVTAASSASQSISQRPPVSSASGTLFATRPWPLGAIVKGG